MAYEDNLHNRSAPEWVLRVEFDGELIAPSLPRKVLSGDRLLGWRHDRSGRSVFALRGLCEIIKPSEKDGLPVDLGSGDSGDITDTLASYESVRTDLTSANR